MRTNLFVLVMTILATLASLGHAEEIHQFEACMLVVRQVGDNGKVTSVAGPLRLVSNTSMGRIYHATVAGHEAVLGFNYGRVVDLGEFDLDYKSNVKLNARTDHKPQPLLDETKNAIFILQHRFSSGMKYGASMYMESDLENLVERKDVATEEIFFNWLTKDRPVIMNTQTSEVENGEIYYVDKPNETNLLVSCSTGS